MRKPLRPSTPSEISNVEPGMSARSLLSRTASTRRVREAEIHAAIDGANDPSNGAASACTGSGVEGHAGPHERRGALRHHEINEERGDIVDGGHRHADGEKVADVERGQADDPVEGGADSAALQIVFRLLKRGDRRGHFVLRRFLFKCGRRLIFTQTGKARRVGPRNAMLGARACQRDFLFTLFEFDQRRGRFDKFARFDMKALDHA